MQVVGGGGGCVTGENRLGRLKTQKARGKKRVPRRRAKRNRPLRKGKEERAPQRDTQGARRISKKKPPQKDTNWYLGKPLLQKESILGS